MSSKNAQVKFATNLRRSEKHPPLPYRSKQRLLSDGELRFYRALAKATAGRHKVMPKVRLTDVIEASTGFVSPPGRKISQRHVDFVLVTSPAMRIVAVVELDDSSHLATDQQRRDQYLSDALHDAGIPLIRFPIYRRYCARQVRNLLYGVLRRHNAS